MKMVVSIIPYKPDELRVCHEGIARIISRGDPKFEIANSVLGEWEAVEVEVADSTEIASLFKDK